MIWRRVQVSPDTTLRELHGIFQVVMGWEGIHLRRARNAESAPQWIAGLLARRPAKVVAIAMANKTARVVFALLTKSEVYRKSATSAA